MYLSLTVTCTRPSTSPVSTCSCRHCPAQKGQQCPPCPLWCGSAQQQRQCSLFSSFSFPCPWQKSLFFLRAFPILVALLAPQAEDVHLSDVYFLSPNRRQCSAKGNHRDSSALSSLFISPMSLFTQYFSPATTSGLMKVGRFPQPPVM